MLFQNLTFRIRTVAMGSTPTFHHHHHQLHLLPNSWFRFISSTSHSNFTVAYLINTCGLSPESALKASKQIDLKSPTKPDSVLSLFKTFDIPRPYISKLITSRPKILLADPDKTIKPKLELLSNMGMSGANLGNFFSRNPTISLEKQIIPSINFLKGFVLTEDNVVKVLSRSKWVLELESKIGPNIAVLRDQGVTESDISKLMIASPGCLYVKPGRFIEILLELKKMGVGHSDIEFLRCLHVRLAMKKSTWDSKLTVFKSFGWSEDEVISMFKRQPFTLGSSGKKINLALNFFMNNLNFTRAEIARTPTVLNLSLEKRVIPRSYVLQILLSKDLIKKFSIATALKLSEDVFVKKFVIKYLHEVPNLLKMYQSKLSTPDQ